MQMSLAIRRASIPATVLLVCLWSSAVQAQASRTWVSGTGDDANPCTRTAQCKTFAGAVSKTATGGLISLSDPGSFGQVTLMRGMSIVADGAAASVLSTTHGLTISAGPSADGVLSG